ncbi:nucleotidyltransferase family protein [Kineosporia succinea]|uniref:Nicotine blue oxidoreductase n=1 Tax=Kineosporia succinea TaxID=84632 RepID=A0ABT9NZS6_9ACTN|nr:nucleotidyltransferase family protein [Kineosporia succinea]MDP9825938.1 nicotine blue oxidoreductase [Kineosporia succinea]
MVVAGIVLAAGAGVRMGRPKGLVTDARGTPWVRIGVAALVDAGCTPVVVVTGARSEDVSVLVPPSASPVYAADWAEGIGASLRAGLKALQGQPDSPDAAVVALVDTPDVTAAVVSRVVKVTATSKGPLPKALTRACYDGRPGHPVLIGRDHWAGVIAAAKGDAGARHYLRDRDDVVLVECADLASGTDRDTPEALRDQGEGPE